MHNELSGILTFISMALGIAVAIVTIIYVNKTKGCTGVNKNQAMFLTVMSWIEVGLAALALLTVVIGGGVMLGMGNKK